MLLVDLQDIGSRYYTYVWTMALAMQAAARAGVKVVVLDRPNPLGGVEIEGGDVEPEAESFVGLGSIPVRHGLTIGELARLVAAGIPWGGERFARPLDCDLEVVPMQGWRRRDAFEATGLPWVLPSPNMPTVDTAFVYPGSVPDRGHQRVGGAGEHPALRDHRRAFHRRPPAWPQRLSSYDLPGDPVPPALVPAHLPQVRRQILRRASSCTSPTGPPSAPTGPGLPCCASCGRWGARLLAGAPNPTSSSPTAWPSTCSTGGDAVRLGVERAAAPEEIFATWLKAERAFPERRRPYLLY